MITLITKHLPSKKWWHRTRWELQAPLQILGMKVPAYFITDGISTPWLLCWIVSPTGRGMPAAVLHDYMLSRLVKNETRYGADMAFEAALLQCGVSAWRARCMFFAVRFYAFLKGAY